MSHGQPDLETPVDRVEERLLARRVPIGALQAPPSRPAPVAVHDDGDVAGHTLAVETGHARTLLLGRARSRPTLSPVRWTAIVNPVAGRAATRGGRGRRSPPRSPTATFRSATRTGRRPPRRPRRRASPTARACSCAAGTARWPRLAGVAAGSGGTIGIVPTGTGNDFARHLGIDGRRPLEALALLESGRIASCDLGRVTAADGTTAWFTTVANTGFDADANRWANGVRWASGTTLYVLAMLRTLATYRPAGVEVVVDGRAHDERAWLVAVANSRYYAGGMMIAPGAEVDDGQLDVCLVGPVSRGEFLARFPRVFRGTHTRLETVRTWRGATVELRATSPAEALECWASGERVGPLPATLTAVPAALRVLVPAGAPVTGR